MLIDYILYGILLAAGAVFLLFTLSHIVRTVVTIGIFAAIGFSAVYAWGQFSNTPPTETIRQIIFSKQTKQQSKSDIEFNKLIVHKPANRVATLAEIEHRLGLRY